MAKKKAASNKLDAQANGRKAASGTSTSKKASKASPGTQAGTKKASPKKAGAKKAGSKKGSDQAASTKKPKLSEADLKTAQSIARVADAVCAAADGQQDPFVDIPSRTLSNVSFNKKRRFIELGEGTNRRQLFNLGQAKAFMQTMLIASGVRKLIDQGKTLSVRGLFYMVKGTIAGTKEETFDTQDDSDPILEDVEVLLNALREELHVFADNRGNLAGPLTIVDTGDAINCAQLGSAGYSIPSIVEPEIIQFRNCTADFVLHVEKGTVWRRFNEDRFWRRHNCLVTHGGGQPARGARRLLHRLHHELNLPIYCLLDNDPWGYYIYSVIKQGSINLAFESQRMAVPDAKYLGLRSGDFERCELSDSVKIKLTDTDKKRAKQIASYPWFADKKPWQREIEQMLQNDFKLEVEALISKDISYVTETYVPELLQTGPSAWLD